MTSAGELLAAIARLSDDELLVLDRLAWRLANEATAESGRPRIAAVIHRCGVVLAEEQDRRRGLVEHARQQLEDGRAVCSVDARNDLDSPSTD
jgi:hypothetical protein